VRNDRRVVAPCPPNPFTSQPEPEELDREALANEILQTIAIYSDELLGTPDPGMVRGLKMALCLIRGNHPDTADEDEGDD